MIWVSSLLPKQAPAASGVSLHGASLLPFLCASRRAFAFPLSPCCRTSLLGCSVLLWERSPFRRRVVLSSVTFLPHTEAWKLIAQPAVASQMVCMRTGPKEVLQSSGRSRNRKKITFVDVSFLSGRSDLSPRGHWTQCQEVKKGSVAFCFLL